MSAASTRAFAVPFRSLRAWSVLAYNQPRWAWPERDIRPLSVALREKRARFDRSTGPAPLLTIRFDGSIEPRDDTSEDVAGSLFEAGAGDVVYSKIDLRNGAIGIVPAAIERACVTSEYPVYEIDPAFEPRYIQILFRTRQFRRIVRGMVSGASGRKRVAPAQLLDLRVPLPSVATQRAIVQFWMAVREEVDVAYDSLQGVTSRLDSYMRCRYEADATRNALGARYLAYRFGELTTWDIKAARARAYRDSVPGYAPFGTYLEDATELVRPSALPDHEWPVYGVNNRTGVFLSHYQRGSTFNASYKRIAAGWFFHNPTRAVVGSLGIVGDVPDDAITSPEYQVWRVRSGLLPQFVATLIGTRFFLDLVDFHRVGAVKQRLYTENLFQIPLPQVPIAVQRAISIARTRALRQVREAEAAFAAKEDLVEQVVIGNLPVDDIQRWAVPRG